MTLNQWARLKDLANARRQFLGLTWGEIVAKGGPTDQTLSNWSKRSNRPSPRMHGTLNRLDDALEWATGTAWNLVAEDRSTWSKECLDDEKLERVEGAGSDLNVGVMTAALRKLRQMDDESAKRMRAELGRMFDLD